MSTPLARLALCLLLAFCIQSAWGSWQYTNGQEIPSGNFTCLATVTESGGIYTGTAVIIKYDDGTDNAAEPIPPTVPIQISVNTTNSEGQPIQDNKTVNCTVQGFSGFALYSDAHWSGDVNIIGSFNLDGHNLTVNKTSNYDPADPVSPGQPGNLIHQSGWLHLGGGTLDITGSYLQHADNDGDGNYESPCNGNLFMMNDAARMIVRGDAQFWIGSNSNFPSYLTAGLIDLKGSFTQKGTGGNGWENGRTFCASGTHRVWLSGDATQTVSFESPGLSYFNILKVTNPHPLVFGSIVQAARVTGNAAIEIKSSGDGGVSGTFESDIAFSASNFTILSSTDLNGHSLTLTLPVDGKVMQNGSFNLSGAALSVAGDWIQKAPFDLGGGDLTVGGDWNQAAGLDLGLSGNLSVTGDFIHQSGWLHLGGGTLDITGSYLQHADNDGDGNYESPCNGNLFMMNDAAHMIVGGNAQFWIGSNSNFPSYLTAGLIDLKGSFTQKGTGGNGWENGQNFRASGTHRVWLSGDATQTVSFESPGLSYFNILKVTNPHPLVFGSIVQAARVTGNSAIEIKSPDEGGISGTLESDVSFQGNGFTILSSTDLNGHSLTLTLPADGKVMQNGSFNLSGSALSVAGDWIQKAPFDLGSGDLTVGGDWNQAAGLDLGLTGNLTVAGDFIHQSGWLHLGGGTLDITGSYLQQADNNGDGNYESPCNGNLFMMNDAAHMIVGGDAQFWIGSNSSSPSYLTAGLIDLKGSFTQKGTGGNGWENGQNFRATGTHRVWLSGSTEQTVSFESPGLSFFNILKVTNPHPLVFDSIVQAARVTGNETIAIEAPGEGVISGISGVFESNVTFSGSIFTILSSTDLNGHSLTLTLPADGKVMQNGSFNLSGFALSVAGDWIQKAPFDLGGGDLTVGGDWNQAAGLDLGLTGNLTVAGDFIHQSGGLFLGGGTLDITGSYLQNADNNGDGNFESPCNGNLFMFNDAARMIVRGDVQFWVGSNSSSQSYLTAGLIDLKGSFIQKGTGGNGWENGQTFRASGTHRVWLSGGDPQTVSFESPGLSFFNILKVTNSHPLVFDSIVQAARVTGNAAIEIVSSGDGGISGTFESDIAFSASTFTILSSTDLNGHTLSISGNMTLQGDLNLHGGNLVISGDLIHQTGWLTLGGGSLDVTGSYLQQADNNGDGTYESPCNGGLNMSQTADYMLVRGDIQIWCTNYHGQSLTSGTIEAKADFKQKGAGLSDYYYYFESGKCFRASGSHKVKLSGTGTQTVTFDSPGSSYFSILEVTNAHLVDTSTIAIANGGSIHLDYPGTDVVGALYLGGTQQPNGLYDSTNSGGLITGTGKIQVGPFANYSDWTTANAPAQTTDQDHDQDGVANGIEYFMGKSGNDFTPNPGIVDGTVTWLKSPAFNGSYAVQTSADLVEWTDVTDDPAQVTKNTNSVIWMRPTGHGSRFVRLLVTSN